MGAFMAANLQKAGYDLVIHDVRREAGANRLAAGATWAETPRAVAEQSDVGLHLAARARRRSSRWCSGRTASSPA